MWKANRIKTVRQSKGRQRWHRHARRQAWWTVTMVGMVRPTVAMGMRPEVRWLEKARHEGFGWMQRHDRKISTKLVNRWRSLICNEEKKKICVCLEIVWNPEMFIDYSKIAMIFSVHDHNNGTKSTYTQFHNRDEICHSNFEIPNICITSLNRWIWHERIENWELNLEEKNIFSIFVAFLYVSFEVEGWKNIRCVWNIHVRRSSKTLIVRTRFQVQRRPDRVESVESEREKLWHNLRFVLLRTIRVKVY